MRQLCLSTSWQPVAGLRNAIKLLQAFTNRGAFRLLFGAVKLIALVNERGGE